VSATTWNWISQDKPATASRAGERSLTVETWHEDGALVLGSIALKNKALVLSVNSQRRSDLGLTLLSEILGQRVGQPAVKTESVEQIMASRDVAEPQQLAIREEELCAIVHDHMDRHYRKVSTNRLPRSEARRRVPQSNRRVDGSGSPNGSK
jgi:hypothetical protein